MILLYQKGFRLSENYQDSMIPYICHILVCVNDRKDERKSCAPAHSGQIRLQLKTRIKERWPGIKIRVSQTGCLGVCEDGPNILIYPQNIWFKNVAPEDIDSILDRIGKILSTPD